MGVPEEANLARYSNCSIFPRCFLIQPAFDWANKRAWSKDTPGGTATRTPLNGRIETLILLALRLRSNNTLPTLLSSTLFDFSFNLIHILLVVVSTNGSRQTAAARFNDGVFHHINMAAPHWAIN